MNWSNSSVMKTRFKFSTLLFSTLAFVALTGFTEGGPGGFRKVVNDAFQPGELLEYRVHYGSVTAGTAKLEVKKDPVMVKGRPCYHMVGQGISSKSFSLFFKVNDRYETFMDQESLMSWKFKRRIEEGSFHHYAEVEFDQEKHKAFERTAGQNHTVTYDVPAYIQDVVSAFYFARTQDYTHAKPGDLTRFQNFIDHKVHDLDVAFLGREVIDVGGIKYRTVKLKPLVREGGIFQHEGDLYLWISDDANRIPVRVESGLVIGSVQVDLAKASNLRHPMTARVR
jgi:Protein of unknown function (DUF3108)